MIPGMNNRIVSVVIEFVMAGPSPTTLALLYR